MGTLWRSEEMTLVQLFVQNEQAHDTVDELGNLGAIQFKDLNPEVNAFHRNFVNEVRRCDELERKLRFFEEQLKKADLIDKVTMPNLPDPLLDPDAAAEGASQMDAIAPAAGGKKRLGMDDLEALFEEREREFQQLNANEELISRSHIECLELRHVLRNAGAFFDEAAGRGGGGGFGGGPSAIGSNEEANAPLLMRDDDAGDPSSVGLKAVGASAVKLGFLAGVMARDKMANFERVCWRTARGNMYLRQAEIAEPLRDPHSGDAVEKSVFVVFFQGERLAMKIKKICDSFSANIYDCPDAPAERADALRRVDTRITEMSDVLTRTETHKQAVLSQLQESYGVWFEAVLKEKSIYHVMNMFNYDTGRQCLIGEGWCPTAKIDAVHYALRRATERAGGLVPSVLSVLTSHEEPPTFFQTNKFTDSFQGIVDSYGVARYREINPAVFTIITFPFLFGVMYGDIGHGLLMTMVAAFICIREKHLSTVKLNEIVATLYEGRYIILLMGIFSIYAGFLYNEFFSVPVNIFGSSFYYPTDEASVSVPREPYYAYPFGADPEWKGSQNELDYYNSLKMKLSLIIGVTHMQLGLVMSLLNAIYFKQPYDIWFVFIPQFILLTGLFGYMNVLIVIKWCTNWQSLPATYPNRTGVDPPVILTVMVNVALKMMGPITDDQKLYGFAEDSVLQLRVQQALLFSSLAMIPIMVFVKPLLLRRDHQKGYLSIDAHTGEEFNFSECMVNQMIHSIEFILGCVSNTASYLRLWALSLAHSELSTVFWDMVLADKGLGATGGMKKAQPLMIFGTWAIWAALTVGILLIMESLSAFLHALRLHWVEFQNKFYFGDGKAFRPFSFRRVMLDGDDAW